MWTFTIAFEYLKLNLSTTAILAIVLSFIKNKNNMDHSAFVTRYPVSYWKLLVRGGWGVVFSSLAFAFGCFHMSIIIFVQPVGPIW